MTFSFPLQSKKENASFKILHSDPNISSLLSNQLSLLLSETEPQQDVVLVCVGTDRSTGDSLGPLVGSQLAKVRLPKFHLYGTLDEPVHAINLGEVIDHIGQAYDNPFVIAIDACLGQLTSVGAIQVGKGPVKPGAGVNKELPPVGDIHITGIVNVGGFMEYFVLQNTRLSLVMRMAEIISASLHSAIALHKQPISALASPYSSLDGSI